MSCFAPAQHLEQLSTLLMGLSCFAPAQHDMGLPCLSVKIHQQVSM